MIWTGREERSWGFRAGEQIASGLVVKARLGGGHDYESYLAASALMNRDVVVKLIRPHLVDESHPLVGLRREAEVLEALEHRAIVSLLGASLESDRPHLVLAHLEGTTLQDEVTTRGARPETEALQLLLPVAEGLAHMSERGFVHLDVKPHNVIVGETSSLIDFGIARSLEDAARMKSPAGTDAYMAPEQTAPSRGSVGPKADVWSLGATLYFALTGSPPFPRAYGARTGPEGRWPQLSGEPKLPPSLSAEVTGLLQRCLEKDHQQRADMSTVERQIGSF